MSFLTNTLKNEIIKYIKNDFPIPYLQKPNKNYSSQTKGTKYILFDGSEIFLNTSQKNTKKRDLLISKFKSALEKLDIDTVNTILKNNDEINHFLAYKNQGQFIIRDHSFLTSQTQIFDNPLPKLITNYIKTNGPIRFDQYWNYTQFFPALGIYNKTHSFSDFFISPSMSENMDYSIGLALYIKQIIDTYKKIRIVEIGPGTGDNIFRILKTLEYLGKSHSIQTFLVETSPTLIQTQKYKLKNFAIEWSDTIDSIPNDNIMTVVLADMVFDSFPHRIFKKNNNSFKEYHVDHEGLILDNNFLNQDTPILSDIPYIKHLANQYIIARSTPAEDYFKKIISHFKKFIFINFDHILTTPEQLTQSIINTVHFTRKNNQKLHLLENSGDFFMACSLYWPLYEKIIQQATIPYKIYSTYEFFNQMGNFTVYKNQPQFKTMIVWNHPQKFLL